MAVLGRGAGLGVRSDHQAEWALFRVAPPAQFHVPERQGTLLCSAPWSGAAASVQSLAG